MTLEPGSAGGSFGWPYYCKPPTSPEFQIGVKVRNRWVGKVSSSTSDSEMIWWKMTQEDVKGCAKGVAVKSEPFEVCGRTVHLSLFPTGQSEDAEFAGLFLNFHHECTDLTFDFQ